MPHSCGPCRWWIGSEACGEPPARAAPRHRGPTLIATLIWLPGYARRRTAWPGRRASRRARRRARLAGRGRRELEGVSRPRSCFVGEPGIGKTRLLAELGARADARAHRALGQRVRARARPAVLGLRRRARRVRRRARPAPPRALDDEVRSELARVLPSLAELARRGRARRSRTSATARTARCGSCSSGSRRTKPLVLVLDDLHWADCGVGRAARRAAAPAAGGGGAARARARPRQLPERLAAALERADRAGHVPASSWRACTRGGRRSCSATASTAGLRTTSTTRAAATRSTSSSSRARRPGGGAAGAAELDWRASRSRRRWRPR